MGTSSSGGGAGGGNPLIPSWIGGGGGGMPPGPPPLPPEKDNGDGGNPPGPLEDNTRPDDANRPNTPPGPNPGIPAAPENPPNRYTSARKDFNVFVKSGGKDKSALRRSLSSYTKRGGGGSSTMAKRMSPSASRVVMFYNTLNSIQAGGVIQTLKEFNLASYAGKPLNETLSALSDEIFKDSGRIYDDTQDDSITKQAYSNTIIRICEIDGISLDNLTNDQIILMTAVFIEETISQRVICDIGNDMTEKTTNVSQLLEVENNVYQIVSGLVRNQILPQIEATKKGSVKDLNKVIENIYRIAFDAMSETND